MSVPILRPFLPDFIIIISVPLDVLRFAAFETATHYTKIPRARAE
jgi:hypothetical protein